MKLNRSRITFTIFSLCLISILTSSVVHADTVFIFNAGIDYRVGDYPLSVTAGDFNEDGHQDLAVTNRGDNNLSVLLGNGDGSFQSPVNYSTGINYSIEIGDFNEDGHQDLVVANNGNYPDYVGSISVLLGNGDGTFQTAVDYIAGANSRFVSIGDFNEDGHQDLAVANSSDDNVSALLGNGDGTFQTAVNYGVGDQPQELKTGDFNEDGHQDLAVVNWGNDNVTILIGNGDGTFQVFANYWTGYGPYSIEIGDFNEDGHRDLAIANMGNWPSYDDGSVSMLLGNGDGTFQTAVVFGEGYQLRSILIEDINEDEHQDLVVVYNGTSDVSVLFGNGDGTFQSAVNYGAGYSPTCVEADDFNEDGHQDLAVVNSGEDSISIYIGNGDGSFKDTPNYETTGVAARSLAIGDFNEDEHQDLVVVHGGTSPDYTGSISTILGNGDGTFQTAVNYNIGKESYSVGISDFNEDGHQDLVATSTGDYPEYIGTASVLLGNGDGTFQDIVTYETGGGASSLAIGDFNEDGHQDLVVANYGSDPEYIDTISVLLGNGDGSFQAAVSFESGIGYLTIRDLDEDGHQDLVVADGVWNRALVLLGNGDGTFQSAVIYDTGDGFAHLAIGDFNEDGHHDIAGSTNESYRMKLLFGNGDGTFQPYVNYGTGGSLTITVGNFNEDDHQDLAVVSGSNVICLLGNGDGTFIEDSVFYRAGKYPRGSAVGDFNEDGQQDLAVANFGGYPEYFGTTSILINIHEGTECWDNDLDGYDAEVCGGEDCDDSDPDVNPGADEVCDNSIDDDCDDLVDLDDPDCCWDNDADGYDDEACGGDDCDDSDPNVNPGMAEVPDNGIDDNCNGQVDEGCFIGVLM